MKKVLLYSAIVIAVLAVIFWKLNDNKKKNAETTEYVKESNSGAVPVLVKKVTKTAVDPKFTANGNFEAIEQIDFSAESSGRIVSLMVKEGSRVSRGQVLARIDNQVASAELDRAEASANTARTNLERFQKALKTGGVTQKQVDDMEVAYQDALARLAQAKKGAQNTLLKSPINGIINAKFVEVGTYLAPGTKIFEIVNISRLKLEVKVPEQQVVQLKVGQEVPVSTNVYPEVNYKGKITFIAAKGDESLNYPVEIEIANVSGKELKAGMYGTATFDLPDQEPKIYIPRAAFYSGMNNAEIFVMKDGKAVHKSVVVGNVYGDKVEVRDGLEEGEVVIYSGQVNLVDGTPVTEQK